LKRKETVMKRMHFSLCLPFVLAAACASNAASPELVDARRAYDRLRMSDANGVVPEKVASAKQALERAESAHADSPGSFEERERAYVAERASELAAAYAELRKAQNDRARADEDYKARQDMLRRAAENQADRTQRSLDETRNNLVSAQRNVAAQSAALEQERKARQEAEKNAAAAVASLREVAQVKEESRGTVITLDGAVLFVTGKSELMPLAQQKLDQVAKALGDLDDKQTVVVEGHTDSKGPDDANMVLSQARAESVRAYLVSRGVKPERISAIGRGEAQPVATNDTPEGRANNRRVEIVISPKSRGSAP
jgi:outer membrane protein OmpA-like peptidoglycan-associated protein